MCLQTKRLVITVHVWWSGCTNILDRIRPLSPSHSDSHSQTLKPSHSQTLRLSDDSNKIYYTHMSRYTQAAAAAAAKNNDIHEEDEEYEFTTAEVGGVRIERDFMRRNISQYHSIYSSLQSKFHSRSYRDRQPLLQPHFVSLVNTQFPYCQKKSPGDGICTHFLRRGFTKPIKYQLNTAVWSADGRWLVLGTQSGDFALWEGEALKVHKVVSVPAHKVLTDGGKVQDYIPITSMAWNHHGNNLVSGDNNGLIQYCDESFRSNYVIREAHTGAVRGLVYNPFDSKLASCSDDSTVKIWTVGQDSPELTLSGHQSDVRCMDWHPFRSLIATGSRESVIKLWDPKSAKCISNITSHKKSVLTCHWNQNGNWLASGGKDGLIKIFDIRVMKEMESLRGHNCDVCQLKWHPTYESLLISGGYNGSLIYWIAGHNQQAHTAIGDAHRQSIDVIAWHPGDLIQVF